MISSMRDHVLTYIDVTTPYCLYDIIQNRMNIVHQLDYFQRISSMKDYKKFDNLEGGGGAVILTYFKMLRISVSVQV